MNIELIASLAMIVILVLLLVAIDLLYGVYQARKINVTASPDWDVCGLQEAKNCPPMPECKPAKNYKPIAVRDKDGCGIPIQIHSRSDTGRDLTKAIRTLAESNVKYGPPRKK